MLHFYNFAQFHVILLQQIPPDAAPHYRQTYMDSSSLEPDDATLNVVNMYDANSRVPYSPNLVQKMVYSRNEQQLQEVSSFAIAVKECRSLYVLKLTIVRGCTRKSSHAGLCNM